MSTDNPYSDPTAGKTGNTIEILESLTDRELDTYVLYLEWEQQHRVFDNTNMYKSRSYYAYRSGNWIGWIKEIQAERRKKK
jgi:hypothetical protein